MATITSRSNSSLLISRLKSVIGDCKAVSSSHVMLEHHFVELTWVQRKIVVCSPCRYSIHLHLDGIAL